MHPISLFHELRDTTSALSGALPEVPSLGSAMALPPAPTKPRGTEWPGNHDSSWTTLRLRLSCGGWRYGHLVLCERSRSARPLLDSFGQERLDGTDNHGNHCAGRANTCQVAWGLDSEAACLGRRRDVVLGGTADDARAGFRGAECPGLGRLGLGSIVLLSHYCGGPDRSSSRTLGRALVGKRLGAHSRNWKKRWATAVAASLPQSVSRQDSLLDAPDVLIPGKTGEVISARASSSLVERGILVRNKGTQLVRAGRGPARGGGALLLARFGFAASYSGTSCAICSANPDY